MIHLAYCIILLLAVTNNNHSQKSFIHDMLRPCLLRLELLLFHYRTAVLLLDLCAIHLQFNSVLSASSFH